MTATTVLAAPAVLRPGPILLIALAAGPAGCGGSAATIRGDSEDAELVTEPVPLEVDAPYYVPGEQMLWDVSWKGVTGGRSQLVVGAPGVLKGKRAIIVHSQAHSEGMIAVFKHVLDEVTTTIDVTTALPITSTGSFEYGKRQSRIDAAFTRERYQLVYERPGRYAQRYSQRLPAGHGAHNGHSALGALRAWSAPRGSRAYFYALSGRRLYRVDVTVAAHESVRTALGEFPAVRIEGWASRLRRDLRPDKKHKPRRFTVWMSDDDNRVPLQVAATTEYGEIGVQLVAYDRPDGSLPVAKR
jgi:hypothetical protein